MADDLYISKVTVDGVTYKIRDESAETAITNIEELSNSQLQAAIIDLLYPVGALYITTNKVNNNKPLPVGTWSLYGQGKALVGVNPSDAKFDNAGDVFGYADSINVSHSHTASSSGGSATTGSAGGHSHASANGSGYRFISHNAPSIDAENSKNLADGSVEFPRIPEKYKYGSALTTASAGAHTHSVPSHTHSITVASAGSAGTNRNYQPSIAIYVWKRTA